MRPSKLVMGGILLAFSLLVVACGGGDTTARDRPADGSEEGSSEDVGDSEEPAEIAVDKDLALVMDKIGEEGRGYAVEGEEVTSPGPTLRLQAGKEVTITVENGDRFGHDFNIVAEKRSDAEPLWGAATPIFQAGKSKRVTFTPDKAGEFFYVCSVPGHISIQGMWGRLVVEA